VQHEFCGTHEIRGASCPNCNKPLLRILSLSAKDHVLALDEAKTPVVHLLYCWTCSIPYGEFSYKINRDGSVDMLQIPKPQPYDFGIDGPYDGYTGVYPLQKVILEPIGYVDDAKLAEAQKGGQYDSADDLFSPRHQVGGSPFIYNPQTRTCLNCSSEMPVLAAICNDATGNDPWKNKEEESSTFTGNGGVQMVFHFCRDCAIVAAYHSCD
jgi:hypothetical protein